MSPSRSAPRCKSRRREGVSSPEGKNRSGGNAMDDTRQHLDRAEIESFLAALGFVREYAIEVVAVAPGAVTIELPFAERFSGPPGQFPPSMVGARAMWRRCPPACRCCRGDGRWRRSTSP